MSNYLTLSFFYFYSQRTGTDADHLFVAAGFHLHLTAHHIGDRGPAGGFLLFSAGAQGQYHQKCQTKRNHFFHMGYFLSFVVCQHYTEIPPGVEAPQGDEIFTAQPAPCRITVLPSISRM